MDTFIEETATLTWNRALEQTFLLVGSTLTAALAARRLPGNLAAARAFTVIDWMTLMGLISTYLFMLVAGLTIIGVESSSAPSACSVAMIVCFITYAMQKTFLITFFTEQIFIVYNSCLDSPTPRRQSKWYRTSAIILAVMIIVGISMLSQKISHSHGVERRVCHIGLKEHAALVIVSLQGFINLYFFVAFLLPLRSMWLKSARPLAIKCAVFTAVALVSTTANIGYLVAGFQESWLCVTLCGADIIINGLVLFVVTNPPPCSTCVTTRPRRSSFISHFGTALPGKGAVPGVGFDIDTGLRKASLDGQESCLNEQSVWGIPGRSPYWEGGHDRV